MPEEKQTILVVDDTESEIDYLLDILVPDRKQTILVVDDTEIDIDVLMEMLSKDYSVHVATDGESALNIVKIFQPDLILLDILMPVLSGFDVCSQLKKDRNTQDIPVIFITSLTAVMDETHGLELGAVDYITKPFNPAIVKTRIKIQLEHKRYRDQMNLLMARKNHELAEAYKRIKMLEASLGAN
jgi:PleD family two-component response regulator